MRRSHRFYLSMTVLLMSALSAAIPAAIAAASSSPVFTVMNTDSPPPDGVYFRNAPHTANYSPLYGYGVFKGERVEAFCWSRGDAVGPYSNQIWYYALNVTRPTVGSRTNEGWINTHYVNDGMTANHAASSVPPCNASIPTVEAVYFSPSAGEAAPAGGTTVKTVAKALWANPNVSCDTSRAIGYVPPSATTLAGWSLGRLGPIYALARATTAQLKQINYVFMIDPGGYNQMAQGCDASKLQVGFLTYERADQILAHWLTVNSSARLVIMAGDVTADLNHPVNGYAHAGIQNYYFNAIRSAGSSDITRTLVCNYHVPKTNINDNNSLETSHHVMYQLTSPYIVQAPLTSCPTVSGLQKGASWHP